jgi:NitT/TauT family transport system substrate-binding protein
MTSRSTFSPGAVMAVLLVLILWGSAFWLPDPQLPEPLQMAVGLWPGAEPLVIAREAGELDTKKINTVEINWNSAAIRAVGNRVLDVAILSLDEVIRQFEQGYPLKIVMVTDISRGADALLVRPDIQSLADLRGRRIGYEPRTAGAWLLEFALRQAGMSFQDIEPVPLNPAEAEEIFHELSLDALLTTEPWRQRLNRLDLKVLYDSSQPDTEVVRVLAVHPDALELHRQALLEVMRLHLKWMPELGKLGPELEPVLRREGVRREQFLHVLQQLEIPGLERNRRWFNGRDNWLRDRFRHLQVALDEPDKPLKLDVNQVFDGSLLEELP